MDEETRLKRLIYRSWHRGCKETDIVLGQFAESGLRELDADRLALYESLLDENDIDIWNWLTDQDAPKPEYHSLLNVIKAANGGR